MHPVQNWGRTRRQFLWMTAAGAASIATLRAKPRPILPEGPPVPCAVVGVGMRGREILTMLPRVERAEVRAYCDVYEPYLRRGERLAPQARGFQDHRAMLAETPEIQAVIVATPTHKHREIVEAALSAGKHVYCEVPMASTVEDCRAIAAAAAGSKSIFFVGLQNRANPVFEHAAKFLKSRAAGSPVTEEGHWYENNSWRRAVSDPQFEEALNWKLSPDVSLGVLGETGVHTFDVSLRFQKELPTAVTSFGAIRKWNDGRKVPDTVFCVLEYPGGFMCHFEATLANSFRERYYLLLGSEGSILIEDTKSWWFKEADAPSLGWEVYASREQIGNEEGIVLLANATKLLEQGLMPGQAQKGKDKEKLAPEEDPLYASLDQFFGAIATKTAPEWGYLEGYRSAVVAIMAHRSLASGRRVEIDKALFEVS